MGLVRTIMCGMDVLFQNFIFVFIRANSTAAYLCHLVIHYDSTQKTYSVTKLTKMPITA